MEGVGGWHPVHCPEEGVWSGHPVHGPEEGVWSGHPGQQGGEWGGGYLL